MPSWQSTFEDAHAQSVLKIRERIMGRAILAVFMSGLVTAACASPPVAAQVGERVLIRNGFVVPPGKLLLVDDMSVDCVIASGGV